MHGLFNQSRLGLQQSCVCLQVQKLKEAVSQLKARLAASAREVSKNQSYYMIVWPPLSSNKVCPQAVSQICAGGKPQLAACSD